VGGGHPVRVGPGHGSGDRRGPVGGWRRSSCRRCSSSPDVTSTAGACRPEDGLARGESGRVTG
jgi:hypothetical protein